MQTTGPVQDLRCSGALERKAERRRAGERRAAVLALLLSFSWPDGLNSSGGLSAWSLLSEVQMLLSLGCGVCPELG